MVPGTSNVSGRWLGILGIGLILLGTTGCGGKKLYPAQGRVVFDDDNSPLAGGWVTFDPIDGDAKSGTWGDIQADGTFQLGTYRAGDGAMEGRYRAVIKPPLGESRSEKNPESQLLDPRFENFATSPLEYTVSSNPNENHFILKVKRAAPGNPRQR
jgi:hypothetical protein